MSSSFFTLPASRRKRKRQDASSSQPSKKRQGSSSASKTTKNGGRAVREDDDVSISGSESGRSSAASPGRAEASESDSDESALQETAAERRLKLAERYLENIRAEVGEDQEVGFDAEDVDRDLIAARLKEDVAEEKGRVYRYIAKSLQYDKASQIVFGADTLATLGVAACLPYVYTVSKDIRLMRWELARSPHNKNGEISSHRLKPRLSLQTRGNKNRARDFNYQHHTGPILCVAASSDGQFVATGGTDRRLIIWDAKTLKALKVFMHHRDSVTSLVFRGNTNQLFSSSKDRTIKIWSINELAYIETLFGHQDEVVDIATVGGSQERCISVGARDRSARLWKVVEESQLVFRGGGGGGLKGEDKRNCALKSAPNDPGSASDFPGYMEGSLDRVAQLDTQLFVTGSDSGSLSLFSLHKKKPLHVYPLAHGLQPGPPPERSSAETNLEGLTGNSKSTPRWITALKAIPFSDLFVSGSWDGYVRVWRISKGDTEGDSATTSGAKSRIEAVAVLGAASALTLQQKPKSFSNGNSQMQVNHGHGAQRPIRGVINDLAIFERGERGKDGICVVAAVGTEPRMGRWMKWQGKNGAVVYEVPKALVSSSVHT